MAIRDGDCASVCFATREICRPRQRGLTLIELMVALLVAALILTQAIPAFDRMLARNQLSTGANRLLAALVTGRLTAVSRNTFVTFCAGNATAGCHEDWSLQEWIVFVDADHDGQLDAGEVLLVVERLGSGAIEITGNGPFSTAVVFEPSGAARTASGALAMGRLRVCTEKLVDPNATDLVLIASGRVEAEPYDDPEGECPDA